MKGFRFLQLDPDEEILFGPVTTTKSVSFSSTPVQPMQQIGMPHQQRTIHQQQHTTARTSGRTVGVTNKRVVIEDLNDSSKTQIIPNDQVRRVFIRSQAFQGQPSLTLEKVEALSGPPVKLNIKGLPLQAEADLRETFPQAEIVQSKGMPALKIVAILGGIAFFLACVLPVLILLVGKLFVN